MTEQLHDVAHIAHAELLTPTPDESLGFFVDVLGMEEEARDGQSVYLRGWGDYLRYSLKLTEAPHAGLGHVALRAWSPGALERRVAAVDGDGARYRLDRRATSGMGPPTASPTRTATSSSCSTRRSATRPHRTSHPPGATSRSATSGAARR